MADSPSDIKVKLGFFRRQEEAAVKNKAWPGDGVLRRCRDDLLLRVGVGAAAGSTTRWCGWIVGSRIVGHAFKKPADSVDTLSVVVVVDIICGRILAGGCFLLSAKHHPAIVVLLRILGY